MPVNIGRGVGIIRDYWESSVLGDDLVSSCAGGVPGVVALEDDAIGRG